MPAPDLEIKVGGGGGGGGPKIFFGASNSVWSKDKGGGSVPRAPSLDLPLD